MRCLIYISALLLGANVCCAQVNHKKAFTDLDGKKITVKGEIVLYKEKPEIVVTDAGQISVE